MEGVHINIIIRTAAGEDLLALESDPILKVDSGARTEWRWVDRPTLEGGLRHGFRRGEVRTEWNEGNTVKEFIKEFRRELGGASGASLQIVCLAKGR